MEKITGTEPAFNSILKPRNTEESNHNGLTIRQYYAGLAMEGYLTSYAGAQFDPTPEHVAEKSVQFADALIVELNKPKQ